MEVPIGDAYDNSVAEAFFSSPQREFLDQRQWESRRRSVVTHAPNVGQAGGLAMWSFCC